MIREILLEEFGSVVYRVSGEGKSTSLNAEQILAMGLPPEYAEFSDKLWGHDFFRRTGRLANPSLKEMQSKLLSGLISDDKVQSVKTKLNAEQITTEECLSY